MRRRHAEVRGLAFAVSGFVQFERDAIRTRALCFVRLRAPPGIEPVPQRLLRILVENFQPIASIFHWDNELAAAAGWKGDRGCFHQFFGFREAGMPAALIVESPVVVPIFTKQADRHRSSGPEVAVAIHAQNLEFGPAAFARIIAGNNGRTPTSTAAGHTTRSMLRTTGRPPLSSRLTVARAVNGERVDATGDRSIWSFPLPCASSVCSRSSMRLFFSLSPESPNSNPGYLLESGFLFRSNAATPSNRLPAAGAP